MQETKKPTSDEVERSFREGLENVVDFAERMEPHCRSVTELISLAKQGIENDACLRLLLEKVATPQTNRR